MFRKRFVWLEMLVYWENLLHRPPIFGNITFVKLLKIIKLYCENECLTKFPCKFWPLAEKHVEAIWIHQGVFELLTYTFGKYKFHITPNAIYYKVPLYLYLPSWGFVAGLYCSARLENERIKELKFVWRISSQRIYVRHLWKLTIF